MRRRHSAAANSPNATPEVLLESGDAGMRLGVSGARVRQLVTEGVIRPLFITSRGTYLFSEDEVARVSEERARRTAA